MKKDIKQNEKFSTEYHNTFLLLNKYRDVVWSLEVTTNKAKGKFLREMGCNVEEYLDSVHMAGFDFSESGVQEHTKVIEQSTYMLKLLESAIETLKTKHKHGEEYYWILYYTYLSPKQYKNTDEIINQLSQYMEFISYRTYFRKRNDAVKALSNLLWGYSSTESNNIKNKLISNAV